MFSRSHSGLPNEVGHIRVKDRIGPNGEKVLYVEEVQSDWAQQGRDQGFLASEKINPVLAANDAMMQQLYSAGGPFERFMMSVTAEPDVLIKGTTVGQFVKKLKEQAIYNQEGIPLPLERQLDLYKDIYDNSHIFRGSREGSIQTNAVAKILRDMFQDNPELVEKISDYVRATEQQRVRRDPSGRPLLPGYFSGPQTEEAIQRAIVERYVRSRLILENPESTSSVCCFFSERYFLSFS